MEQRLMITCFLDCLLLCSSTGKTNQWKKKQKFRKREINACVIINEVSFWVNKICFKFGGWECIQPRLRSKIHCYAQLKWECPHLFTSIALASEISFLGNPFYLPNSSFKLTLNLFLFLWLNHQSPVLVSLNSWLTW